MSTIDRQPPDNASTEALQCLRDAHTHLAPDAVTRATRETLDAYFATAHLRRAGASGFVVVSDPAGAGQHEFSQVWRNLAVRCGPSKCRQVRTGRCLPLADPEQRRTACSKRGSSGAARTLTSAPTRSCRRPQLSRQDRLGAYQPRLAAPSPASPVSHTDGASIGIARPNETALHGWASCLGIRLVDFWRCRMVIMPRQAPRPHKAPAEVNVT